MCLFPRSIRNPTKHIYKYGGQPLTMDVPCGQCAECKKNHRLQWHFRSYHHVNECVRNGGYVLYDTLTYAPEHLPWLSQYVDMFSVNRARYKNQQDYISDFPVFDHTHWRNFLKNLRRQLDYHFKGVKFTYFLTSEYGTDDRYTHRPHYHILLFVNSKKIHPYKLSRLISKCWTYGRTDGLPYKSHAYLRENVFGYKFHSQDNSTTEDYLKVCSYVSKYITKDSTFQTEIDKRISIVQKSLSLQDEDLKPVERQINMFHRQSQGFGASYIKNLSSKEYQTIMDKGISTLKDKKKVVLTIALPTYYKRKLFYKTAKTSDGSIHWQPNTQGKLYIQNQFERNIKYQSTLYNNAYENTTPELKAIFSHYLGNRSLEDLSTYNLLYKNRSRAINHPYNALSDDENELHQWVTNIINSQLFTDEDDYYLRDTERNDIYTEELFNNGLTSNVQDYDTFIQQNTFTEHSFPHVNHFDKLNAILKHMTKDRKVNQQKAFDFIEELSKKFKILYDNKT